MLFSHTRMYAVYVKPGQPHGAERPRLVREGFNLYAFLFGFFWALYQRLWWQAAMVFAFNLAIVYAGKANLLTQESFGAIQMGFQMFVGFQANDWRQLRLRRKGYILTDIVSAESLTKAEQRYFDRALAAA